MHKVAKKLDFVKDAEFDVKGETVSLIRSIEEKISRNL